MQRALVRRPSPLLADGIVTHIERSVVDVDLAGRQWEAYRAALESNGWPTQEVPPEDSCPDSVFIEDTVVVTGDLAVITLPGAAARRPETVAVEATLSGLGYRIAHITGPGTLDGGDVLKVERTWYVGRGGRTDDAGIAELRSIVAPLGVDVVAIPTTLALHLKSAVTALPDGTVIGYAPVVDDPGLFPSFLAMPEEPGAHVVILDEQRLLLSSAAPRSAELLESLGYRPVLVDISEFEKLEGCVTCLSVRLRG